MSENKDFLYYATPNISFKLHNIQPKLTYRSIIMSNNPVIEFDSAE